MLSVPSHEELVKPVAPGAAHREALPTRAPLRGVLRDRATGKPIPESPVALVRGIFLEVMRTDLEGRFQSKGDLLAGTLTIDPTPFPDDVTDWYSRASGARVEVAFDPNRDEVVELLVDTPAFVIVEGPGLPDCRESAVEAYVVLPGAEQVGPDGTTWVTSEHRRRAYHPRTLSDGSLLISPAPLSLRAGDPPLDGSGEARVELHSWNADCRWWTSEPLKIRDTLITAERVRAADRTECAVLQVSVTDEANSWALDDIGLTLIPLASLPYVDAPASWRSYPEWAESLRGAVGTPLRSMRTDYMDAFNPGGWAIECVPAGEYAIVALHPAYKSLEQRLSLNSGERRDVRLQLESAPIGAPIRVRARWEDPNALCTNLSWRLIRLGADDLPFSPLSTRTRVVGDGGGHLMRSPELEPIECVNLPEGRYRLELLAGDRSEVWWPYALDPETTILTSGDSAHVLIRNAGYVRWTIAIESKHPRDASRSLQTHSLELLRPDGSSAGTLAVSLSPGSSGRLVAPSGEGWRYQVCELGPGDDKRTYKGLWKAESIRNDGVFDRHTLILR
jgi:hypothetical protein